MYDWGLSGLFKRIVSLFQIAPEVVPSAVRVPLEVYLGHPEGKDLYGDRILTGKQSPFGKSIDLVHDGIRHGETADRSTAAVDQDV